MAVRFIRDIRLITVIRDVWVIRDIKVITVIRDIRVIWFYGS